MPAHLSILQTTTTPRCSPPCCFPLSATPSPSRGCLGLGGEAGHPVVFLSSGLGPWTSLTRFPSLGRVGQLSTPEAPKIASLISQTPAPARGLSSPDPKSPGMGPHSSSLKAKGGGEEPEEGGSGDGEESQLRGGGRNPPSLSSRPPPLSSSLLSPAAALTGCLYKPTLWNGDPSGLSILPTFPQGNPLSSCLHSLPKRTTFSHPLKPFPRRFLLDCRLFP